MLNHLPMLPLRLTSLSREGRDTLFMLAVIGWTVAPLASHIKPWCLLLLAGILLWRARATLHHQAMPGRGWLLSLLAVAIAATWLSERTLLGRDAGVSLIVVLLGLKTLEMSARRDTWVVFFLAFFTMLTNFFYSQSLLTAASMLLALWGWLTALVLAHRPVGKPSIPHAALTAATLGAVGAPIMLVLFLLFPRLAPLWGQPSEGLSGRSGLSTQMQIGQIAQLALDDSVAMRVRWLAENSSADTARPPPRNTLYFRGPVLTHFDGRQWLISARLSSHGTTRIQAQNNDAVTRYEVVLEPHRQNWLLVLDGTAHAPDVPGYSPRLRHDMQWTLDRPLAEAVRYRAQSHVAYRYDYLQPPPRLIQELTLPAGYNPRTLEWATQLRRNPALVSASPVQMAEHVLQHLRQGGYSYTLEPGAYGLHAADEFWFERKRGFCEHIASSFAILMRAMDIPARVVTGYMGGERNPLDGLWTIRQSDAHAWVEIWDQVLGWTRIDPTSAVAPGRVAQLQRLAAPQGLLGTTVAGVIGSDHIAWLHQWRSAWEALNTRWNHYVLNYTQGRQLDLLREFGLSSPSWRDLVQALGAVVLLGVALGFGLLHLGRQPTDPWVTALNRLRYQMLRRGLPCLPCHTPRQLRRIAEEKWGRQSAGLAEWLMAYEKARYATDAFPPQNDALRALQRSLRHISWPRES